VVRAWMKSSKTASVSSDDQKMLMTLSPDGPLLASRALPAVAEYASTCE